MVKDGTIKKDEKDKRWCNKKGEKVKDGITKVKKFIDDTMMQKNGEILKL